MSISSFYGLQTSLRGLLAQQRMLDTAGHNIANASTKGYSRQEVVARRLRRAPDPGRRHRRRLRRAPRLGRRRPVVPPRPRSVRRSPVPRAEHEPQRVGGAHEDARPCRAGAQRARRERHQRAARAVLGLLARARRGRQEPVAEAERRRDREHARRLVQHALRPDPPDPQQARDEYADLTAGGVPGGEIAQIAREIAELNKTVSRFMTAGDMPNDLLDRRDQLLDELS